ncbi:POTRA domain-containing protein [Tenacibaculum todarodis]|uniref:POTRA domain-containing protein n=1 Tax=Tenacibaculum todarodis TaxID=1850252 RepID=UPI000B2DA793|nr:POTRA domain-containing protein [Tenacibaculum todarodis]
MTKKIITYICITFFSTTFNGVFGQELLLKIKAKDSLNNIFLKQVVFTENQQSEKDIYNEVNVISEKLKQFGYFLNSIDNIQKKDTIYTSHFTLGNRTEKAFIKLIDNKELINKAYLTKNDTAIISIEQLPSLLTSISNKLENSGKSFSEVKLKNIQLKENFLYADLDIYKSKERTINKIVVKGYDQFSKPQLKRFLNLKKETVFNQQKIEEISSTINSLDFISEIKPPEILFSKDSTSLYIYLKEEKTNSFDGLLNFASKENGKGLLFNGHLDLKLNNILHTGEQFKLFWKASGEERQEFKLTTEIPYILNSPFTPDLSFSIYKQDSTFLSTRFHTGLKYNIKPRMNIAITYDSETSENTLQNNNNESVKDFENTFIGGQFTYRKPNNDTFYNDKLLIRLNPSFGYRNTENTKTNQFKINIEASYLWNINTRGSIYIRNETGYLNSDNFIDNELYRIGGANSIRGFNEQSIFTSQFSYLNIEYRYLTSQKSYLYSITDFGSVKSSNSTNENLYGLGFGYLFKIKNSQINLGYVLGKTSSQNFDFNQSKLIITFLSYF